MLAHMSELKNLRFSSWVFISLCTMILTACASSSLVSAQPRQADQDSIRQSATAEAATLPARIDDLAQQIYKTMLGAAKKKVAILPVSTLTGESNVLGLFISDKLTNALFPFGDKFEVVDRIHLEQVLKELRLSQTGVVDPTTAQQLGKLLGADAIVAGTITDLGTHVDVTLRVLGTEQGNVLAVASVQCVKDQSIAQLMSSRIPQSSEQSADSSGRNQPSKMPAAASSGGPIEFACTTEGLAAWQVFSGQWGIEEDVLPDGQVGPTLSQKAQNTNASILAEIPTWRNYIFELYAKLVSVPPDGQVRIYCCGISSYDNYFLQVTKDRYLSCFYSSLFGQTGGESEKLESHPSHRFEFDGTGYKDDKVTHRYLFYDDKWHNIKISIRGDNIVCSIDGTVSEKYTNPAVIKLRGKLGLGTDNAKVRFAKIRVTPLN